MQDQDDRRAKWMYAAGVCALCTAAVVVCLLLNRQGIGLQSDTQVFFRGAEAESWRALSVHHAPLYSLVLKGLLLCHDGILPVAKALNVLLMALTVGLMTSGLRWAGGVPRGASLLAGLLLLLCYPMLYVHSFAQTEPLFIVLQVLCVLCLMKYVVTSAARWLVCSAAACGMAMVTRYAGGALVVGALLALGLSHRRAPRLLLKRAGIFCCTSLLPVLLLLVHNRLRAGTATARTLAFHPLDLGKIHLGLVNLLSWLVPYRLILPLPVVVTILVSVMLLVVYAYLLYRAAAPQDKALRVLAVFSVSYVVFLIVSLSFFDYWTPLGHRILAPLAVLLVPSLALLAWDLVARHPGGLTRAMVVAACIYLVLFSGWRAIVYTGRSCREGNGFSHVHWKNSATLSAVLRLADRVEVYSNAPEAVYLITGDARVGWIPYKLDPTSLVPASGFKKRMEDLRGRVQDGRAVVAIFFLKNDPQGWCHYFPTIDEMIQTLDADVLMELNDGIILGAAAAIPPA